VNLGGTTLVAHLTAGHTRGATTWTMKVSEAGKSYDVIFYSSLRSPATLTPPVIQELTRSFEFVRSVACDVPLGDHPAEYDMQAKYAKIRSDGPNPFIDRGGCRTEAEIQEAMFRAILAEQGTK
jgi:metallo-beta-lactamase class B